MDYSKKECDRELHQFFLSRHGSCKMDYTTKNVIEDAKLAEEVGCGLNIDDEEEKQAAMDETGTERC